MFPEIGHKAVVKDMSMIDPEWRNADVVIVGMDLRHDSSGGIDPVRSRILVANCANLRRDFSLQHLHSVGSLPD